MHRFRSWTLDPPEWRTQRNRLLPAEGGDGSTLSLDFTTGVLDPRLSFTRTSNATFINSSGLVQWADVNMLANSVFAGASGSTPPTGWLSSVVGGTPSFTTNGTTITISNNNSATRSRIYQNFGQGLAGVRVTVRFRVVANNTGGINLGEIVGFSVGGSSGEIFTVNGVSQLPTFTNWVAGDVITLSCIPAASANVLPLFGVGVQGPVSTAASITIADVQMNPGSTPNPYVAVTNTSIGYYAPRFDYDPISIGTPRGLLIEEGRVNICTYSGDMTQSGAGHWSVRTALVTTSWTGFTAPDGTASAVKIIPDTTSNRHTLENSSPILTSGVIYTASAFVKADGYSVVSLVVAGGQTRRNFTLSGNGTLGSQFGLSNTANITPVGTNGWYRVEMTWTSTLTGNAGFWIGVPQNASTDVVSAWSGNGTSAIQAWGAQIEAGSSASSYIPTGSSQGTRNGELLSMTGNNLSWFSNSYSEGTFLFRGTIINSASGFNRIFALTQSSSLGSATGSTPSINFGVAASNSNRPFLNSWVTANNDVDIYVPVGGAVTNGTEFAVAAAYKAGDWRISSKNFAATSSFGNVGTTWGNNFFMNAVNGVYMPALWYKQLKFIPVRLSNAQMDIWSA